jgi:hypothetical protein
MMRNLARRWWDNYRWLYRVTRSDVVCGAVMLPWTRTYRELRDLRREMAAG